MSASNREVGQATIALCVELMKLSSLSDDAHAALCVTIENAFARFAEAILAQTPSVPELCPVEAVPTEA